MMETLTRSLAKSISWRLLASLTTAALVYAFTGRFDTAIVVGGVEMIAKMVLYVVHERLWLRVGFGVVTEQAVSLSSTKVQGA